MKKLIALLMALCMILGVASVSAEDVAYERAEDEEIYLELLGDYDELMKAAKAAPTNDERFVLYAQAESLPVPFPTSSGAMTMTACSAWSSPMSS